MKTAREIMRTGVTCIGEHQTLAAAAQHMAELGIGALPITGDDGRVCGMLTDRDIVVKCLATGSDPNTTTAGELAQGTIHHVGADASVQQMVDVMAEHRIRRLLVLDEHHLVGIVSEADIAGHLPEQATAGFVKAICAQQASVNR
ncbi:CBS domain-containing protein [Mycolicibacterium fluoranthenivorans]|uniref:CBS domain-containing protein n=1 Tax=Mycolicibacterium fluoranthenivorans TaxID=258505 RepID=A0A7X5U1E7_9MYCO|nr:CBS domain-containing protein [Mycolicibacterium fluoranthenivorans]MCV7354808.1 CBS domain-containing protein [Mycolicibacterium fluoranthenivorans]NIH96605.1 CBS domain-containing protein [Mycolicibacterium fluoranthenivorans]